MQSSEVESYYQLVSKRKGSLIFKRFLDWVLALFLLVLTSPVFLILSIWIKLDSKGPVIYKQERVTQYNRPFKIWKFRTMVTDADKKGSLVTSANDSRITKVGNFIRRVRLDELPQLVNVLKGEMSFVGTRPEVPRYTERLEFCLGQEGEVIFGIQGQQEVPTEENQLFHKAVGLFAFLKTGLQNAQGLRPIVSLQGSQVIDIDELRQGPRHFQGRLNGHRCAIIGKGLV